MKPEDPRHGTEAGYEQHRRDNEDPCAACVDGDLKASRRRSKRRTMGAVYQLPLGDLYWTLQALKKRGATYDDLCEWSGAVESQVWRALNGSPETPVYARTWRRFDEMKVGRIITPLGVTRRIQALMWLGYSAPQIADAAGCHVDSVRDSRDQPRVFVARRFKTGIADAYDRLSMTLPTGETKQDRAGITRTRNMARRKGWLAPLMWTDIDDVDECPDLSNSWDEASVDHAIVQRVLDGRPKPRKLTTAETAEIVRRALALGMSTHHIKHQFKIKPERYTKAAA